jgi:hypothetical protein
MGRYGRVRGKIIMAAAQSHYALNLAGIGRAFLAGALSVLIFQMGIAALLHAAGILSNAPYSLAPTAPFGVPQTLSSAFWGGLWGIVMLPVLRRAGTGPGYWLAAILFGGLIVGGFGLLVVFPLKGRPFAADWSWSVWRLALSLNAVFGLGTAAFLKLFGKLDG